jgi:hypothetical protein
MFRAGMQILNRTDYMMFGATIVVWGIDNTATEMHSDGSDSVPELDK